jgi:secreted trypsin-like serine protease
VRARPVIPAAIIALSLALAACGPLGGAGTPTTTGPPTAVRSPIGPTATTARPVKVGTFDSVSDHRYDYQGALLHMRALDDRGRLATRDFDRFICGVSLIGRSYALTAAHCLFVEKGVTPQQTAVDLRVQFGRPRLTGKGGVRRRVKAVKVHPRYKHSEEGSVYDVAVLTLSEPVTSIEPVALVQPKQDLSGTGQVVTFTGWGDAKRHAAGHEDDAKLRDRMRAAHVALMHRSVCQTVYPDVLERDSAGALVLCMRTDEGVGSCLGDSGGPVVAWRGDEPVQVGIISFGAGCSDPDFPGVATRLAAGPIGGFVRTVIGAGG